MSKKNPEVMSPAVVIAPYRVKPEDQESLFEILRHKRKYFLEAGYVTSRPPVTLRSRADKEVIIEIFEWSSDKHTDAAHEDQRVLELWSKMGALCVATGFPLSSIPEASGSFPHFDPLNIYD